MKYDIGMSVSPSASNAERVVSWVDADCLNSNFDAYADWARAGLVEIALVCFILLMPPARRNPAEFFARPTILRDSGNGARRTCVNRFFNRYGPPGTRPRPARPTLSLLQYWRNSHRAQAEPPDLPHTIHQTGRFVSTAELSNCIDSGPCARTRQIFGPASRASRWPSAVFSNRLKLSMNICASLRAVAS